MAEPQVANRPPSVMEDPSATSVARVYSTSLLDAAGTDWPAALEEFRSFVVDLYPQVPDLRKLFSSPSVTAEDQVGLIDRVLASRTSPLFANFLRVLARHRRLELLPLILDVTTKESERRSGKKRVKVTSAAQLSTEAVKELTAKLAASIAAEPILEATVDPSLLGGLVVRIGDTVYDGSLRTRLTQLSGRLRERCLHEIQRGRDRFCHSEGN